jgi:hypothetical protein
MGLLDDAIREHLELKRRRGADPAEVERLEREALGPVRRAPQATEEPVFDHRSTETVDYVEETEEEWHESLEGEAALGKVPEYTPESPPRKDESPRPEEPRITERGHAEPPEDFGPEDEPEWEHDPMAPSRPRRRPAPASPPPAAEPGETAEFDVEAEGDGGEDDQADGDDMLEETPEFLQDTPDHDRLWFEQRPPRDFDFDS